MTIHPEDPFATPEDQRSPVRRLRGRLPAPVTLWTAGEGAARAGLTVSSVLVVDGEPGRVLGVIDDESALWTAIEATGRFAVARLGPADRQLADRFAGLLPAPGGLFRGEGWHQTDFGPIPLADVVWAGCRLDAARPYGWGLLVEATISSIEFRESGEPGALTHFRGRYRQVPS